MCALIPVMVMPDAAWGLGGGCDRASRYPVELGAAARGRWSGPRRCARGEVLILPFCAYRAPPANGGRVVIDRRWDPLSPPDSVSWSTTRLFVVGVRVAAGTPVPAPSSGGPSRSDDPAHGRPRGWLRASESATSSATRRRRTPGRPGSQPT